MKSPKKQSPISILRAAGLYPGMPEDERKSRLQFPGERYPCPLSLHDGSPDEEADVGYESSWLGIFTSTRG